MITPSIFFIPKSAKLTLNFQFHFEFLVGPASTDHRLTDYNYIDYKWPRG